MTEKINRFHWGYFLGPLLIGVIISPLIIGFVGAYLGIREFNIPRMPSLAALKVWRLFPAALKTTSHGGGSENIAALGGQLHHN